MGLSSQTANNYVADDFTFRPNFPVTPEFVELDEVRRTQGDAAVLARSAQMRRNERRRQVRSERKRYAEVAAQINLRRAAEHLADRKLAERNAQEKQAPKKAPGFALAEPRPDTEFGEKTALSPTG